MKIKGLLINILVLFASLVGILLILEFGIRLFLPSERHSAMYASEKNGNHLVRPNLALRYNQKEFSHDVITNSMGFRNRREFVNSNLCLFIGDSFTFGAGVDEEEHYSSIFSRLVNWDALTMNVYNAGVPGYSTVNEYLALQRMIRKRLKIHRIILGVDISDFNENPLYPIYDVLDGRLVFSTKGKPGTMVTLMNFFAANSELVNFVYYRFVHSSVLKNLFSSATKLKYFEINLPDRNLQLFAEKKGSDAQKKLDLLREYMEKIFDLCRENDIDISVYYIPIIQEVYRDAYRNTLKTYRLDEKDYNLSALNNFVREVCVRRGARFINIKDDIMKYNDERLYYSVDQHFNRLGNFVVGVSLYRRFINDKKK